MVAYGAAKLPGTGDIVDGKYKLERLLGQGGMGAVFAARHIKLGHAVAIKLMLADAGNVEAAQRFINEGRAAANIQNEHVVRVSDVDEENGYAFMVLELLEGEDLDAVLEREIRLAPHVAATYVMQGLDGVKQAHAQGIVHRDLKPANLFLAKRRDGSVIVKVLDFGISKANSGNALAMAPNQLTSTATMLGSPLYMSPEQLRSSKKVDARADIWAMGVILFELMSGSRPFDGDTLGELFSAILETEAPRLSTLVPSIPPGLDAVVARCLQRRAEDRYQTAAELEQALAPFASPNASQNMLAHTALVQPQQHQHQYPPTTGSHPGHAGHAGHAGHPGARTGPTNPQAQSSPGMGPPPGQHVAMARSSPSVGNEARDPNQHVAGGTVPLGAMTPPNFHQTTGSGAAWQTPAAIEPKRANPVKLFAMIAGPILAIGVLLIVLVVAKKSKHDPAAGGPLPSASEMVTAPIPSAPPSASVVVAEPVPPAPPVSASASASGGAGVAGVAPVAPKSGHHPAPVPVAPVVPVVASAKPEPPKAPDAPVPVKTATPVKPPPTAPKDPQQNTR